MVSKSEQAILEIVNAQQEHTSRSQHKPQLIALTYLLSKEVSIPMSFKKDEYTLESDEFDELVEELVELDLLARSEQPTFGKNREVRIQLYITEIGKNQISSDNTVHTTAQDISDQHGDIPISNLLKNIRDSEPPTEWL